MSSYKLLEFKRKDGNHSISIYLHYFQFLCDSNNTINNTVNHLFISLAPLLEGALCVVPAGVGAGLGALQLGAVAEVHCAGRPAPAQTAAVPLPALAPPGLTRLQSVALCLQIIMFTFHLEQDF